MRPGCCFRIGDNIHLKKKVKPDNVVFDLLEVKTADKC